MFAGYTSNQEENDEFKHERYRKKFNELIAKQAGEQLDKTVADYIGAIGDLNGQRQRLLFSILENAVQSDALSTMVVCQSLLNCDKLQFANEQFWCSAFGLIRRVIEKADYKEIRDLVKLMLDLINAIPASFNIGLLPQLNAIYQIFEFVFRRDLALFPAYLVFDEIRKKTYLSKTAPHWKFSKLIQSFVESFRPVASMCSLAGRTRLYPIICNRSSLEKKVWQLDAHGKFVFKGHLPLSEELQRPQTHFLKYAIMQSYSKEFVFSLLQQNSAKAQSQNQNRMVMLEDIFVEIIVSLMERAEAIDQLQSPDQHQHLINQWQLVTNNIRDYTIQVLYQEIIKRVIPIVTQHGLRKGRDQLMWMILQLVPLAFVKIPFNFFFPLIKLIDVLYSEKEPLPLPNLNSPLSVHGFAAATIWIIAIMKAEAEQVRMTRSPPVVLKNHIDFIRQNASQLSIGSFVNLNSEFKLPVTLNPYFASSSSNANSTNEQLIKIMNLLIEYISGNKIGNGTAAQPANQLSVCEHGRPLPFAFLDSLSIQMRVHLVQHLISSINKHIATNKAAPQPISPFILETFFRLAVYSEIENPYMRYYLGNNLYPAMSAQSSVTMHNLIEAWTFRTNHVRLNLRIQLMTLLNNAVTNYPQINYQLKHCVENCLLRLLLCLNPSDIIVVLTQVQSWDNIVSKDSEDFNKILILVIARAIHITHYSETLSSEWCNDILSTIMAVTPFAWSKSTINCFPKQIREFYEKQQATNVNANRRAVTGLVDEEYAKFNAANGNEAELTKQFLSPAPVQPPQSAGTPGTQTTPAAPVSSVFICCVWKSLLERDQLNTVVFKVLDKMHSKQYTANVRSFCDYLVFEFAKLAAHHLNKYIDTLNDLIWKYHIFTLDKLFLCLLLRPFEEEVEFNVSLLIIQHILLKKSEFRSRMQEFVKEFSPEHWLHDNAHEKQTAYLAKYPEKFFFEFLPEKANTAHPYFFSNVCLRFLPVLDLTIARYLEHEIQPNTTTVMETILDQLSPLYKFHDQPITLLYNTLHYYEPKLRNKPAIKRKLLAAVLGPFRELRSKDWALSDDYQNYIANANADWSPGLEYYMKLVGRLVDTIAGRQVYPNFDWKFYEFANSGCHALHIICVELMALPKPGSVVAANLLDIIMIGHKTLPREETMNWVNAIGLILTALPADYKSVLSDRIIQQLQSPLLTDPAERSGEDIFKLMDFTSAHKSLSELQISYLIALAHAFYQHSYIGQVSLFPEFLSERVKPIIRTEEQFIFVCHLVAPFLDRLVSERTRIACDLNILLYQMLELVDQNVDEFLYMEPICDLLYYIKYSFTGDSVKDDIEPFILKLREPLRRRLRFVVHLPVSKPPAAIQNNLNQMAQMGRNSPLNAALTVKQEQFKQDQAKQDQLKQQEKSGGQSLKHGLDTSPNHFEAKRLKTS